MKENYFNVHKNKKPKKLKYSKPYSKTEKEQLEICYNFLRKQLL